MYFSSVSFFCQRHHPSSHLSENPQNHYLSFLLYLFYILLLTGSSWVYLSNMSLLSIPIATDLVKSSYCLTSSALASQLLSTSNLSYIHVSHTLSTKSIFYFLFLNITKVIQISGKNDRLSWCGFSCAPNRKS